jgi:hypothetical protein
MGNMDTGNDPADPEPLLPEGVEASSDPNPAALLAAKEAIDAEINEGAHAAADAPIPAPGFQLHPVVAAILPMRDDASIRESARHIGPNDPIDPIILYEEKILDRWDHYLACLLAKREPTFETYAGDDPLGFLIDRMLGRGYPDDGQRAMMGARLSNLRLGANQYSEEGVSIATASKKVEVSRESIFRARRVLAYGIPELVKAVDDGKISISAAAHICLFPELDQRERLRERGLPLPARGTISSLSVIPGETSPSQAEAAPSNQAEGSSETDTAAGDAPEAVQPASESPVPMPSTSTSLETASGTPSAEVLESPGGAIPHASGDWILRGDSPVPGVTAIVGSINAPTTLVAAKAVAMSAGHQVFWLTAQRGVRSTLHPLFAVADGRWECIEFRIAETDDVGLPILNLGKALAWLDYKFSSFSNVGLAVVDYFSPYLVCGDLEQTIPMLRQAVAQIHEIAIKHSIAVVMPCRLPCSGGPALTKAIDALAEIPELQALLFVKGTDSGTIFARKGLTRGNVSAVDFRTNESGRFGGPVPPIVLLKNGVAPKPAKREAF